MKGRSKFPAYEMRHLKMQLVSIPVLLGLNCASAMARDGDLSLEQHLIVACYDLDVARVAKCLNEGADVNAAFGESSDEFRFVDSWEGGQHLDTENWTPLMAVANASDYPDPPAGHDRIWEHPEQAYKLKAEIGKGVLEKRRDAQYYIVLILLSHKPDIDRSESYGATALYMAVDNNKPRIVRALLEFGANPNTRTHVYIDGPDNQTPLHRAWGSKEVFQMLLEYGANASARDSTGQAPRVPEQ